MHWTNADAWRAAVGMGEQAGFGEAEPELLRFGNNAVFALGEAHVLRVLHPTVSRADVQQEIELVRELARLDVPTVRLADLTVEQPLEAHGCLGTVWERLAEPHRAQLYPPFGRLLRTFHERTADLRVPLERWRPLASSERRLAALRSHYAPDNVSLLNYWFERIAAELDRTEPVLPGGVIHGQAEVGNVLLRAGEPVLIDFERVAIGPREWDLVDTAVTVARFGLPEQYYRDFRRRLRLRRPSLGRLPDLSATLGAPRHHLAHATRAWPSRDCAGDRGTIAKLAGGRLPSAVERCPGAKPC